MQQNDKYIVQEDNAKSNEAVGTFMGWIMVAIAGIAAISYAFQTVAGWYYATLNWLVGVWQFIASFWPF